MKRKGITRRVTKKQKEKMRSHFVKKKQKIVWDQLCVAELKLVSNELYLQCDYVDRPKKTIKEASYCEGCSYNRRKKRVLKEDNNEKIYNRKT